MEAFLTLFHMTGDVPSFLVNTAALPGNLTFSESTNMCLQPQEQRWADETL